jgi:uncharacterized protein YjiS (DUF1127 family)
MNGQCSSNTMRHSQPLGRLGRPARNGETLLVRLFDALMLWQERTRSRQALQRLDQRMLHDIGIDRSQAEQEGSQPFWR